MIHEISALNNPNQFAVGLSNGGIQSFEIRKVEGSFELVELNKYLTNESVQCIHGITNDNTMLVGIFKQSNIKVIDLKSGLVTKEIPNPSGDEVYNSF